MFFNRSILYIWANCLNPTNKKIKNISLQHSFYSFNLRNLLFKEMVILLLHWYTLPWFSSSSSYLRICRLFGETLLFRIFLPLIGIWFVFWILLGFNFFGIVSSAVASNLDFGFALYISFSLPDLFSFFGLFDSDSCR